MLSSGTEAMSPEGDKTAEERQRLRQASYRATDSWSMVSGHATQRRLCKECRGSAGNVSYPTSFVLLLLNAALLLESGLLCRAIGA